jgi:hypothetical protein
MLNEMTDSIFGKLHDVYEGHYAPRRLWQAAIQVDAFNEPLRVQFETTDDLGVEGFYYTAFEDFLQHQRDYKAQALDALLIYYQTTIRPLWQDNDYFGVPELAPFVQTPTELEKLLSHPCLFIHPPRENTSSLGLSFECSWDVEHGTGILLRKGRVVHTGLAEVANYDVD